MTSNFLVGSIYHANVEVESDKQKLPFHWSLSANGYMGHVIKSCLLPYVIDNRSATAIPIFKTAYYNGPIIVQLLKIGNCSTFRSYYDNEFLPYGHGQLKRTHGLDIIWDIYLPNNIKEQASGSGTRHHVTLSTPVPFNRRFF